MAASNCQPVPLTIVNMLFLHGNLHQFVDAGVAEGGILVLLRPIDCGVSETKLSAVGSALHGRGVSLLVREDEGGKGAFGRKVRQDGN